jgi:signal peptide peptidase SppA
MNTYDRVARAVLDTPWFIREAEGLVMADIVRARLRGERLAEAEIHERVEAAQAAQGPRRGPRIQGAIGVIPIYGVIMPRSNLMIEMSGGTSVASARASFREALADEAVGSIILEFDSPGGAVDGIEEFASEIRAARGQKPIVAIANTLAASAAYYLASQADEVVASPSAMVGSIGVFIQHTEFSKMDTELGATTTIIRRPAAKAEVNDAEPLPDSGRAHLQEVVDDYYDQFIRAVAAGRGVSPADVRAGYGEGRAVTARRAKAAGLVDRIDTLDDTIRRLATGKGPVARGTSAQATDLERVTWAADEPAIQGGDASPAEDPEADATGEAGTPPDRSSEAAAAVALARARIRR